MTATAARIGFITQEWRKAISTTSSVATRYGALARETDDPIETFFDSVTDAQAVANARQTLLSAERRRFRVDLTEVEDIMALTYSSAVPLVTYVDTERGANMTAIVSEIVIDFDRQSAELTVWG